MRPTDSPRACAALGEEAVEAQLVGGREREAAVVGVGVDVVGLDAVEALAGGRGRGGARGSGRARRGAGRRASARPASLEQLLPRSDGGEVAGVRAAAARTCRRRGSRRRGARGGAGRRPRSRRVSKRSTSKICASTVRSTGPAELPLPRRVGRRDPAGLRRRRRDRREVEPVDAQAAPAAARAARVGQAHGDPVPAGRQRRRGGGIAPAPARDAPREHACAVDGDDQPGRAGARAAAHHDRQPRRRAHAHVRARGAAPVEDEGAPAAGRGVAHDVAGAAGHVHPLGLDALGAERCRRARTPRRPSPRQLPRPPCRDGSGAAPCPHGRRSHDCADAIAARCVRCPNAPAGPS